MKKNDHPVDSYFRRNTFSISLVEFFWGLGLPVITESLFLQVFLKKFGATNFMVGLVPTIFNLGLSLFPLLAAFLMIGTNKKKPAVILFHLLSSAVFILLGFLYFVIKSDSPVIPLFFIFYTLFSIFLGLTIPVWQAFIVKLFTTEKVFKGLAIMQLFQSAGKVICAYLILTFLEAQSFSLHSSAVIFFSTGLLFFAGSLFFLLSKEILILRETEDKTSFIIHFKESLKKAIANKHFMLFLFNDLELFATGSILAFYANYAVEYGGLAPALTVGLFTGLNHIGAVFANIFIGWMNLFSLKGKLYAGKYTALAAVILLLFSTNLVQFLIICFLLGMSRGIRFLAYSPAIDRFSGKDDSIFYFAIAPLITLPVSLVIPAAAGYFLDCLAFMGIWSYKIIFGMMGLIIFISFYFLKKIEFKN